MKTPTAFLLLIIVGALGAGCSKDSTTNNTKIEEITLKQAEQIVYLQILNSNDSGKVVYELPSEMHAGTTLKAKGGDSTYFSLNDSWFFFINDNPGYRWVHPCRYLFVACSDGKYFIVAEINEPENIDSLRVVAFK